MTDIAGQNSDTLALAELSLRRYEARLGVWKVVLGTFIVGLAGIIIPAAINVTTLFFEDWRAEAQQKLEQRSAHQQYIKDFFETAITQDIELRIRFAQYFSALSTGYEDVDTKAQWAGYLQQLLSQRTDIRSSINELEAELVMLEGSERTESNVIQLDRVSRELQWAYDEIGYVALDRSRVQVVAGKKERLYSETLDIVRKLASSEGPIDPTSVEYKRFWELYRKDLIPVESTAVESRMVALGRALEGLAFAEQPPDRAFFQLWQDLERVIRRELIVAAQSNDPNSFPSQLSALPAEVRGSATQAQIPASVAAVREDIRRIREDLEVQGIISPIDPAAE